MVFGIVIKKIFQFMLTFVLCIYHLPATAFTILWSSSFKRLPLRVSLGLKIDNKAQAKAVLELHVEIRALTLTGQHQTPSAISES